MKSHLPHATKVEYYEPLGGEVIDVSARNSLALARERNSLVVLQTSIGNINVLPDGSIESISQAYQRLIASRAKDVIREIPEKKEWLKDYEKYVESIVNVNVKNISELLVWFEGLYKLQQKTHIPDNSLIQDVLKILEENGYSEGYKSELTPQEMTTSPEESRKWFIGALMKSLKTDGVLLSFNMHFIDEYRELLESE